MLFHTLQERDLIFVKEIYDWYILHSTTTFHTEPITIPELKEFIFINHPKYKSFLMMDEDTPIGFCYLTRYKNRQAYNRTAEVTLYLDSSYHGKTYGSTALSFLEEKAIEVGIKNLIGIITGNNTPRIKLFENCGYSKCGHFKNVGEKFGEALDVVAYQKEI